MPPSNSYFHSEAVVAYGKVCTDLDGRATRDDLIPRINAIGSWRNPRLEGTHPAPSDRMQQGETYSFRFESLQMDDNGSFSVCLKKSVGSP